MYKIFIPFALVIFFTLSACSSEYTCVCIDTSNGQTLSSTTIEAKGSAEAQEQCDNKESIFFPDRCEIQ